jgi:hypothetical protein
MTDRNTPYKDAEMVALPVAANGICTAGRIATVNSSGSTLNGAAALLRTAMGRYEETVDNTGGANGAKTALIRRNKAFRWKNSGSDPVTQASVGKVCYIADSETVAATNGSNTRSAAGTVVEIDTDGVWVE